MKDSLKIIFFIQVLMVITIALDIYVVRQVLGFIYLTFLPGYLLIKLLKIDFKDKIDEFLFSFGISIGYTMIIGLLINVVFPLIGIQQPLSILPILVTLSCVNIILILINHRQGFEFTEKKTIFEFKRSHLKFLFLIIPPLSGIIGSIYKDNYFLIFMIFVISVFFLLLAFMNKYVPKNMYPFIIFSFSIALIFHTSLTSKYLIGGDVNLEYQVFKITKMNSIWDPSYFRNITGYKHINNINAMLSTTILPTIYSIILNIREDVFFKIISPFMLSFIPIILYRFYEKEFKHIIAIFAVFFFISDHTMFFGIYPINLNRQIIAEIFFTLSIFILFHNDIDKRKRQLLFLFFGSMVMVSHYATSYVFLFYLVFLYIFLRKRFKIHILDSTSLIFLALIKVSWDAFISIQNIQKINRIITNLYNQFLVEFLNPTIISPEIQRFYSSSGTIITRLHSVVFYIVNLLLLFGIIELFRNRKTSHIDRKFRILAFLAFFSVVLAILIPDVTKSYKLRRFRTFAMFFLSPLIIIGSKSIFDWMNRVRALLVKKSYNIRKSNLHLKVASVILVSYLLFNIGFVNYITNDKPISASLDISRIKTSNDLSVIIGYYGPYIPEQDFFSTIWLSNRINETYTIYADHASSWHVLHSYGVFSSDRTFTLRNDTELEHGDYIYLSHLNYVEGIITLSKDAYFISEITDLLDRNNKIYTNGDSEIYSGP